MQSTESTTPEFNVDDEVRKSLRYLSTEQLDHLERMIVADRARRAGAEDTAVEAMTGEQADAYLAAAAAEDPALVPA